jgi:hypothetical protein
MIHVYQSSYLRLAVFAKPAWHCGMLLLKALPVGVSPHYSSAEAAYNQMTAELEIMHPS